MSFNKSSDLLCSKSSNGPISDEKSGGQMEDAIVLDQVLIPKSSSSVTVIAECPSPPILSSPTPTQPSESAGARVSGGRAHHEPADANSPAFASALAEYMRLKPSGFGEQHLLSSTAASSSSADSASAAAAASSPTSARASLKQESNSSVEHRERAPNRTDKHPAVASVDQSCIEEFKPAFWYLCTSPTSNRTDTTVSLDCLALGTPTIISVFCR